MKVPSFSWLLNHLQQSSTQTSNPFENPATSDPLETPVGDAPYAEPPAVAQLADTTDDPAFDSNPGSVNRMIETKLDQTPIELPDANSSANAEPRDVPANSNPFESVQTAPTTPNESEVPASNQQENPFATTDRTSPGPFETATEQSDDDIPVMPADPVAETQETTPGQNPFETPVDPFRPETNPGNEQAPADNFPADNIVLPNKTQTDVETATGDGTTEGTLQPPPLRSDDGSNWYVDNWPVLLPFLLVPILLFGLWRWLAGRRAAKVVASDEHAVKVERQPEFGDAFHDTGAVASGFKADPLASDAISDGLGATSLQPANDPAVDLFGDLDDDAPVDKTTDNIAAAIDSAAFDFSEIDEAADASESLIRPGEGNPVLDLPDNADDTTESLDSFASELADSPVENSDTFNFDDDDEFDAPSIEIDEKFEPGQDVADSDEFGFGDLDDSGIDRMAVHDDSIGPVNFELDESPGEVFSLTADESVEDLVDDGLDQVAFDPVEEANAIHEAELAQAEIDAAPGSTEGASSDLHIDSDQTESTVAEMSSDIEETNGAFGAIAADESGLPLNLDDDEDAFTFDEDELAFDDEPVEGIVDDRPQDSIGNDNDLEFDFSEDEEFEPAGFVPSEPEFSPESPRSDDVAVEAHSNGSAPVDSDGEQDSSEQNDDALVGAANSLTRSFAGDANVESGIDLDDLSVDSDLSLGGVTGAANAGALGLTGGSDSNDSSSVLLDGEIVELRAEINVLREENNRLNSEITDVRSEMMSAVEANSIQEALNIKTALVQEAETTAAKEAELLKSKLAELDSQLELIGTEKAEALQARETAIRDLDTAVQEKEAAIGEQEATAGASREVQDLNEQLAALQRHLESAERHLESAERERDEAGNLLQETSTKLSETTDQLGEANSRLSAVQSQLEELESDSDGRASANLGTLAGLGSLSDMANAGMDKPQPEPAVPTGDDAQFFKRAVYERKRRKKAELRVEKLKALAEEAEEQAVAMMKQLVSTKDEAVAEKEGAVTSRQELVAAIDAEKLELESVRSELESAQLATEKAEQELAAARSNQADEDELHKRDREIEDLQNRLNDDLAVEKATSEKLIAELKSARSELEDAKKKSEESLNSIQLELVAKAEALEAASSLQSSELQGESKVAELESVINQQQQEFAAHKKNAELEKEAAGKLRTEIKQLKSSVTVAQAQAAESNRKFTEQETAITDSAETIAQLQQELQNKVRTVETDLATSRLELDTARKRLATEQLQREQLAARQTKLVDPVEVGRLRESFESQIASVTRSAETAVGEKESLLAEIEKLNADLRNEKTEKADAVKDAEEKQRLISKLEYNAETATLGPVTYLQSERNELVGVKDSGVDVSALKLELNAARQETADLKKEYVAAEKSVSRHEKKETDLQKRIEQHLAEIDKLKATAKPAKKSTAKKPATKSSARKTPAKKKPDNLKLIKGIGEVFEKRLQKTGVTRFSEIARWSKKRQKEFEEALEAHGRIVEEDWVGQAAKLASKK